MVGVDTTVLIHLEIKESAEHLRAQQWLQREVFDRVEPIALVPQVLVEFVHVVTDARRFQKPLTMEEAIGKARFWWNAEEVRQIFPTAESTALFFEWLAQHGLGRKRLLDTFLAATFRVAGVQRIATTNARDFSIFGGFEIASY